MIGKSALVATILAGSATAFAPSSQFSGARVAVRPTAQAATSMSVKDMPGVSAPLGFFDPLGFSKGNPETVKQYRESELRHGRVAMLAVAGWLTAEVVHLPMFQSASNNPLKAASSVPFWGYVQIVAFCGVIEFIQSRIRARPGFEAGDYLGSTDLVDEVDEDWKSFRTKELNNGRLAMLAIIGFIGQTAIFNESILEQSTGKTSIW